MNNGPDTLLRAIETSVTIEEFNNLLQSAEAVAQIAANDNGALRMAARYGRLDIVNRLLEFPDVEARITANDNRALLYAAINGHLEIQQFSI
jgi:ankyrin repeat protein